VKSAILLFAHGARDARWAEPFQAIADRMRRADPGRPVELAFLEIMSPDIHAAARHLVAAGATRVDVVPLFLGSGGHLRQDLPPLVEAVRSAHAGVEVRLHAAIGENVDVIDAMSRAILSLAGFGE